MATSFTINVADLTKILEQIKIAERHAAGENLADIIGQDAALLPVGLRTVDGSFNHLLPGQERVGAADELFPRLLPPVYGNDQDGDQMPLGPPGSGAPTITNTNYDPTISGSHSVADADPRIISNLIVDQTVNNPAALAAALKLAGSLDPFGDALAIGALVDAAKAAKSTETAFEKALAQAGTVKLKADAVAAKLDEVLQSLVNDPDAIPDQGALDAAAAALTAANEAKAAAQAEVDVLLANPTSAASSTLTAAQALLSSTTAIAAAASQIVTALGDGTTTLGDGLLVNTVLINAQTLASSATAHIGVVTSAEATAHLATVAASNTVASTVAASNLEVTADGSIMIEHRSADIGLSPANNGWFTLFGQFFDHGLDLVTKGNNGTVYIPLQPDDPLYVEGGPNFMALTRATTFIDPVTGLRTETQNTTTPFIDQNQTYTSHASHQVFLREYVRVDQHNNAATNDVIATGRLLDGAAGSIANWADVKAQALDKLGIKLSDFDVHDVPLLRTDAYGRFIPGSTGYAQMITGAGADGILNTTDDLVVHGSALGTAVTSNVLRTGHAFLNDIAHHAAPGLVDHDQNPSTPKIAQVADSDTTGVTDDGDPLTYDNEMLDAHFITGDGRGNENIGLTAVHTVFHAEHNRLVEDYKATILGSGDLTFINEWIRGTVNDLATLPTDIQAAVNTLNTANAWDGERLFQAGRFVTEMQYQHLVFEEFARRIQPAVDAFVFTNSADLNPAIVAEFAHVVYRFGHSQLTDGVDRLDNNLNIVDDPGTPGQQQIGLIEAFLNPQAFTASGVDAAAAVGSIVRGMAAQTGNEMDEFVVEALRNNLVGLPLDLAALNIARGRDTGIPSFNDARAQFYASTGDAQLKPYTSWLDFAQNMKHPESIINFIAAYGTHATITAASTIDAKRDAAMELVLGVDVNGGGVPSDRLDFLNARGMYAGGLLGGLNSVDFWVGGLAEEIMEFGGQLGSTFGYVFEAQMEALQNGDRFYYLSRTQGMNLLNQLEPNTFTDIVMRNTDLGGPHATHMAASLFDTPDYILELDTLVAQNDYNVSTTSIDPEHDNSLLQAIDPKVVRINGSNDVDGNGFNDGNVLKFSGGEHVVLGGTEGNDSLYGDKGIDTLWGDAGDDYLNAGMETDQVFGGEGDDIIEDPFGDDFLRGNQGNDVISSGHSAGGIALLFGDTGNDFLMGATDGHEYFAGEGNDFILGGTAAEVLLGNEGDDWLEGGEGFDGLSGDNSELFFNSIIVGHDILNGQGNDTDYDGENGDDIMFESAGIQRNNGMDGFDWAIHKGDANAADSDLGIRIFDARQALILRDRFDSVEGLSGWKHDDVLTGANKLLIGENFSDALTQAGVDRIAGLRAVLGNPANTGNPNGVVFESDVNTGGEIILGGGGNDTITGNLGDDFLDGDAWLNVRLSVRTWVDGSDSNLLGDRNADGSLVLGGEVATFDTLTSQITWTSILPESWQELVRGAPTGLTKSLASLMTGGQVNPGQLEAVREILTDANMTNSTTRAVDVAVFNDVFANYTITDNGDGSRTVTHNVADSDGIDRIRNFEILQFADQVVNIGGIENNLATGSLAITISQGNGNGLAFDLNDTLTVSLGNVADPDGLPPITAFTFTWQIESAPGVWETLVDPITGALVQGTSFTPTTNFEIPDGTRFRVVGSFRDAHGIPEVVQSLPTPPMTGLVPDPAVELGLDLTLAPNDVGPDGVAVVPADFAPGAPIGIFEDVIDNNAGTILTAFTFTRADLLANVTIPTAGLVISNLGIRDRAGASVAGSSDTNRSLIPGRSTQRRTSTGGLPSPSRSSTR